MDNLFMLIIFATYCLMLCAMAFVAGQLLVLVMEHLADRYELGLSRKKDKKRAAQRRLREMDTTNISQKKRFFK